MSESGAPPRIDEDGGLPAALMVRDRLWIALAATPGFIGLFAALFGSLTRHGGWLLLAPLMVLAAITLPPALRRRRRVAGVLTADPRWICWNGNPWIRRGELAQAAWREDAALGAVVHLATKRGAEASLVLPGIDAARTLVADLGHGAARHIARFHGESLMFDMPTLRGWLFTLTVLVLPGAVVTMGTRVPIVGLLATAYVMALAGFILAHWIPATVVVGADAVSLSWLGRVQYFPIADIFAVAPIEAQEGTQNYVGLLLLREDGTTVRRILIGPRDHSEAQRDLVLARIREVIALHGQGDRALEAASLERRGRNDADWVRGLRAAGAGADADMRHAPIPSDRLWALVEDAGADALSRAAAAVAVSPSASAEQRDRIRFAAASSASPALRRALERASDEQADEEAMADSLSTLERARHL